MNTNELVDQTDKLSTEGDYPDSYGVYVSSEGPQHAYIDRVTAGPYRKSIPKIDDGSGGSDRTSDQFSVEGVPQITLNWAYYFEELLSGEQAHGLTVHTVDEAPAEALTLNAVTICSDYRPPAYYEEYQTPKGAQTRLDRAEDEEFKFAPTTNFDATASVITTESFEGYPNQWYLLDGDDNVYGLSRGGNLIAGGSIPKDAYMDPLDTLRRQIRTRERPEGPGMAHHPFRILPVFEEQYGSTSLDMQSHTAASIPMDELTASRAKALAREWYDDASSDSIRVRENSPAGFGDYPVDAHETYEVKDTQKTNFRAIVTSWVSQEHATRYARNVIDGTDWTFDVHFPNYEYDNNPDRNESTMGPYDESFSPGSVQPPNCGLVNEDDVQKLRVETTAFDQETPATFNIFSGVTTIIRI
ncbi:hypothetical protein QA599_12640 [Haloarculaceae archaeon H-GB1-1]|nr:hypothetical protein [Haloarculaceae archaeon H-GB1-1]